MFDCRTCRTTRPATNPVSQPTRRRDHVLVLMNNAFFSPGSVKWNPHCSKNCSADVMAMTERLAKSARVRQSIIRHAFRYFMGRNEVLSDSRTMIDADQAYLNSGGSFDAVIVSLLTSDSFIYRKAVRK